MKKLTVPESGSMAGTTASRNRYGQYNRTRAMPAQPRTDRQTAVRSNLATLSQAWRLLSDNERASWTAWADGHPTSDSLGQVVRLTGHQAFISVNTTLKQAEGTTTNTPPDDVEVSSPLTVLVGNYESDTFLYIGPSDPAARTVFFSSPPVSAGISFIGDYRFLDAKVNDDALITLIPWGPVLLAKFGVLAMGKRYGLKFYFENSGLRSADQRGSVVLQSDGNPLTLDGGVLEITPGGGIVEGDTIQVLKASAFENQWTEISVSEWDGDPITVAAGNYRVIKIVDGVKVGITTSAVATAV